MFFKNFKNNWYFLACGLYITFCELNLKNKQSFTHRHFHVQFFIHY